MTHKAINWFLGIIDGAKAFALVTVELNGGKEDFLLAFLKVKIIPFIM